MIWHQDCAKNHVNILVPYVFIAYSTRLLGNKQIFSTQSHKSYDVFFVLQSQDYDITLKATFFYL
jgi:hypothetical protein